VPCDNSLVILPAYANLCGRAPPAADHRNRRSGELQGSKLTGEVVHNRQITVPESSLSADEVRWQTDKRPYVTAYIFDLRGVDCRRLSDKCKRLEAWLFCY